MKQVNASVFPRPHLSYLHSMPQHRHLSNLFRRPHLKFAWLRCIGNSITNCNLCYSCQKRTSEKEEVVKNGILWLRCKKYKGLEKKVIQECTSRSRGRQWRRWTDEYTGMEITTSTQQEWPKIRIQYRGLLRAAKPSYGGSTALDDDGIKWYRIQLTLDSASSLKPRANPRRDEFT